MTPDTKGRDWRADPKPGDQIAAKRGYRVARRIIDVNATHVQTSGFAGGQRNRWMQRSGLKRYDLVASAEEVAERGY